MKRLALWLTSLLLLPSCFGPKPKVKEASYKIENASSSLYAIDAVVENKTSGEGQAKVTARLIDKKTGLSFQGEKHIDLKAKEEVSVHIPVRAPASDYLTEVEVEYPPR